MVVFSVMAASGGLILIMLGLIGLILADDSQLRIFGCFAILIGVLAILQVMRFGL